jgi:hypothetical protein
LLKNQKEERKEIYGINPKSKGKNNNTILKAFAPYN